MMSMTISTMRVLYMGFDVDTKNRDGGQLTTLITLHAVCHVFHLIQTCVFVGLFFFHLSKYLCAREIAFFPSKFIVFVWIYHFDTICKQKWDSFTLEYYLYNVRQIQYIEFNARAKYVILIRLEAI